MKVYTHVITGRPALCTRAKSYESATNRIVGDETGCHFDNVDNALKASFSSKPNMELNVSVLQLLVEFAPKIND